ncbi:hypothetical protein R4Z10_11295 [Niallia sp. XMNu-256]
MARGNVQLALETLELLYDLGDCLLINSCISGDIAIASNELSMITAIPLW